MTFKDFLGKLYDDARDELREYAQEQRGRFAAWATYQWNRPVAAKYALAFAAFCVLLTIAFFGGIGGK